MHPTQVAVTPGLATGQSVVVLVVLVVGVVLLVVGASVARRSVAVIRRGRRLRAVGERARGVVVDVRIHTRGRGDDVATSFSPVVAFTTGQGRRVTTVAGPQASAPWIGRTPVDVLHDPDDPEHAEVLQSVPGTRVDGREGRSVVVGGVLALVGVGVLVVAVAGLVG